MSVYFDDLGWKDYLYWQKLDKKKVKKINELIDSILRDPFDGIGKPEPLRFDLQGCWSRRIDGENRLVFKWIEEDRCVVVLQCRYHYERR